MSNPDVVSEAKELVERVRVQRKEYAEASAAREALVDGADGADPVQRAIVFRDQDALGALLITQQELTREGPRIIEALLARLDTLAPLAEAAARVREAQVPIKKAADAHREAPSKEERDAAYSACMSAYHKSLNHESALLALARGER